MRPLHVKSQKAGYGIQGLNFRGAKQSRHPNTPHYSRFKRTLVPLQWPLFPTGKGVPSPPKRLRVTAEALPDGLIKMNSV